MALTQDILMAVSRNESNEINLANINEERYDSYTCSTSHLAIDKRKPLWYHYILCGIKGCLETLPEGYQLQGMNILVDGEVPPNAGLSSSSALVCCAALATFQVQNSFSKLINLEVTFDKFLFLTKIFNFFILPEEKLF
jgi:N-acetylgalactosamine kinase